MVLKHWLHNHGDAMSTVGGVACFAAGISTGHYSQTSLPSGTPHAGHAVVVEWDHQMNHEMTIIGYDDTICYDFNGDQSYTNDIDINDDGIVDMRDWEIGGVLMVNSWGAGWANAGKAFVMYRLLAEPLTSGGIMENTVHVLRTRETSIPQLALKLILKHNRRNQIKVVAGVAADPSAMAPDQVIDYPIFNYQGGITGMQGGTQEPDLTIETGIDMTPLLGYVTSGQPAKYFLQVLEDDPQGLGTGEVIAWSVIDYTQETVETAGTETNVALVNNGATILSLVATVSFNPVTIVDETLPIAVPGKLYDFDLSATGGAPPYEWCLGIEYTEGPLPDRFPVADMTVLTPSSNFWGYAIQDLEFSFPFYGESYDQIVAFTDGVLFFNDSHVPMYTENSIKTYKAIVVYGYYMRILPQYGEGLFYEGDANHATFRWLAHRYPYTNQTVDCAVTLYPDGTIDFFYDNDLVSSTQWVAGISAGDGFNYNIADVSRSNSAAGEVLRFTPPDYPLGLELTHDGTLQGTVPGASQGTKQNWDLLLKVYDNNLNTAEKIVPLSMVSTDISGDLAPTPELLAQNYPNPFNPITVISYHLSKSETVTMSIYDLKGQRIRRLVNELQGAGSHSVIWDGKNDCGETAASGTYVYRIEAGQQIQSHKLVLLK